MFIKLSIAIALFFAFSVIGHCAGHEEGVKRFPTILFYFWKFPITDSIVFSWIASFFIIFLVRYALKNGVRLIPTCGQSIVEAVTGGFGEIIEPIVGKKTFKIVFPCLLAFFFFIFLQNISGLFPGVGSIGFHVNGEFRPLFRPANADLNTTLALAIVAFFAWLYFCIRCVGAKILIHEIFGNKAEKSEISSVIYLGLFLLFFAVGLIECISILCRIVSLSFRLFGNTFGGENLLHNMSGFAPILQHIPVVKYLAYLIPLPFYFLEFLVAMIQSFVFTLLVSVYIGLVCNHEDSGHNNDHKEIFDKDNYVNCNS